MNRRIKRREIRKEKENPESGGGGGLRGGENGENFTRRWRLIRAGETVLNINLMVNKNAKKVLARLFKIVYLQLRMSADVEGGGGGGGWGNREKRAQVKNEREGRQERRKPEGSNYTKLSFFEQLRRTKFNKKKGNYEFGLSRRLPVLFYTYISIYIFCYTTRVHERNFVK